jgi:hypothetical protein
MARMSEPLSAVEPVQATAKSKKAAYAFMGLLVAYALLRGIRGAAAKPFWFDELLTLTIAGQSTLHGMWMAITRGFDGTPPLFFLVERAALKLVRNEEIAL